MRLLVQPEGIGICGQTSMAMVTGAPVSDMVRHLPTINGTGPVARRNVLLAYYAESVTEIAKVDNRKALDFSGRGIVSISTTRGKKHGHAMAFEDGRIFDPGGRIYADYHEMMADYNENWGKGNVRIRHIAYVELNHTQEEEYMAAESKL